MKLPRRSLLASLFGSLLPWRSTATVADPSITIERTDKLDRLLQGQRYLWWTNHALNKKCEEAGCFSRIQQDVWQPIDSTDIRDGDEIIGHKNLYRIRKILVRRVDDHVKLAGLGSIRTTVDSVGRLKQILKACCFPTDNQLLDPTVSVQRQQFLVEHQETIDRVWEDVARRFREQTSEAGGWR